MLSQIQDKNIKPGLIFRLDSFFCIAKIDNENKTFRVYENNYDMRLLRIITDLEKYKNILRNLDKNTLSIGKTEYHFSWLRSWKVFYIPPIKKIFNSRLKFIDE